MTLLDLCILLKKRLWLVIGLPIVCAVVAALVIVMMPKEYSATATITASGEVAGVGAFATDAATQFSGNGVEITASNNTSTRVITLTAKGNTPDNVIKAVNKAANNAFLNAFDRYNVSGERLNVTVTLTVKFAETATDISQSPIKVGGIALIAGLFIAICIVVIIDMARGTIHSARELEEESELRLLGRMQSDAKDNQALARDRLFANIQFASGEHKSVCILPIDTASLAARVCQEVAEAAKQADRKALLMDADLNGSSALGALLPNVGSTHGLADVLADTMQLSDTICHAGGYWYVPAGAPTETPSALLDTSKLTQVLEQAALEYDLVIVYAPETSEHADFSYITHAAGSTVLCVKEFGTKRAYIEEAASQLAIAEAHVVGFVAAR